MSSICITFVSPPAIGIVQKDSKRKSEKGATKKPGVASENSKSGTENSKSASENSKSADSKDLKRENAFSPLDSSNNESVNGGADESVENDGDDDVEASGSDNAVVGGDLDGWRRWCASEAPGATKTKIIFRLPDGERDQLELVRWSG